MRDSNVVSKSKDSCQRSQSGNISKMPPHESSLATIRKEYDSSESESVPSSDRSSQICSQQASSAAGSYSLYQFISLRINSTLFVELIVTSIFLIVMRNDVYLPT